MSESGGESLSLESLFAFVGGLDAEPEDEKVEKAPADDAAPDAADADASRDEGASNLQEPHAAPDPAPDSRDEAPAAPEPVMAGGSPAVREASGAQVASGTDAPAPAPDTLLGEPSVSQGGIDLGLLSLVTAMPAGDMGSGPARPAQADEASEPSAHAAEQAAPADPAPSATADPGDQARREKDEAQPEPSEKQQGEPVNLLVVPAPPPPRGKHASGVRLRERAFGGRHAPASASVKAAAERPQEPKPESQPRPDGLRESKPQSGPDRVQEQKPQPASEAPLKPAVRSEAEARVVSAAVAMESKAGEGGGDPSAKQPRERVAEGETSASIDARLEALVRERLAQMRGDAASEEKEPVEAAATSTSDDLLESLARMLALDDADTRRSRIAGDDGTRKREAEEPLPDDKKEPSSADKKEPSSADKLDSVMFEEPPASIKEVMREAEGLHRRGLAIKVGAVAASSALALGLVVFAFTHLPDSGGGDQSPETEVVQQAEDEAPASPAKPDAAAQTAKDAKDDVDRSGEVVYRYTLEGSDGEARSVTETVAFGKDGMCESSTLEVELADEATAQSYLADLERDFGSALEEGAADGAVVRAVVDVSSNDLDREGYEDALRVSVEDLAIVKKS